MSSEQHQADGGCVTVEYTTEEKRALYSIDPEVAEGVDVNTSAGLATLLLRKLL